MGDDCLGRQADEVEALSAIYGDEWCVIDEMERIFCIRISEQAEKPQWTLNLQIHFPDDYPLKSPPQYQLNATWLRGVERCHLEDKLSQIYCENLGEDLIYLWVEAVRDFLQKKADNTAADHRPNSSISLPGHFSMMTEEVDCDDGFDPAVLEGQITSSLDYTASKDEEYECPVIHSGETLTDRKSTFQAHLASLFYKQQVRLVLEKLMENKKIANATHNMFAYRIVQNDGTTTKVIQGCEDDGETQAGSRMLHLLQIVKAENVLVVVSRWYGGIHLGPDRFRHINNCTRTILEKHGYLMHREEKKGPRSGKKGK